METKGAKGYLFAFFQVQTAIAAPLLFRTMFPPPQSRIFGIIIFLILLLAGSLTFFENKKLVPLLQATAGLALIACIALAATIGPIGEILSDTFNRSRHMGRIFARIPAYSLSVSPFQIVWVINDMISSSVGRGFFDTLFGGNSLLLYYVHAGVGFVFWLWYLFFISFRESSAGKKRTKKMAGEKSIGGKGILSADTGTLSDELKKLHAFAKGELSDSLLELEQYRRLVKSKILQDYIYFGLTIAGVLIFGFYASVRMITDETPFGVVLPIMIVVWVAVFLTYLPRRIAEDKNGYMREFKGRIISPLIRFIDPTLSYRPEDKIDKVTFERGGMISTERCIYNGSDLVTGRRDGRSFAFSNLIVIKKTLRYSRYITLFNGLYFSVPVGSPLRGKIYLIPNQRKYGGFRRKINLGFKPDEIGEQVPTGNKQFDQLFSVYSKHPREVKTLLHPVFLERCITLLEEQKAPVYLAFVGHPYQRGQSEGSVQAEMHSAVPMKHNAFGPPLFSSLIDFGLFIRCYRELAFCLKTVELPE